MTGTLPRCPDASWMRVGDLGVRDIETGNSHEFHDVNWRGRGKMSPPRTHVLLHRNDNILVSCRNMKKGEVIRIDNRELVLAQTIPLGHKIARRLLPKGEKIRKYGVPIGSALADIAPGEHVHLHNMKSDYIVSHTRSTVSEE